MKILNFIFVLVIALSFTFIGVKSVVFKTIFNKEYVLEQMETNNFYSETYKLVESGFENYIGQSGLDEEVIKNICTEDKIKAAIMGTLVMSLSGELADRENPPVGTFKTKLFDNMFTIDEEVLNKYAKIEKVQVNCSL